MKLEDIRLRDPFIFAEDGYYYLYGSEVFSDGEKQWYFKVYKSRDLKCWDDGKIIFQKNDGFWATKNFWAPELHKYKGKYYLFASFEHICQLLVCDTPDGEFVPLTDKPFFINGYECIDGTFYVDKKGNPYIAVSHNELVLRNEKWMVRDGAIEAFRIEDDLKSVIGGPFKLIEGCNFEKSQSRGSRNTEIWHVTEGPFFYRGKEDLYLLWSGFKGKVNGKHIYFQAVAKSDNGEIDGNWVFQDELLKDDDSGHGMLFKDFDGNLKLVLHYPNNGNGIEKPVIYDVYEKDGKLITV